jgi:transcriptional regulator with XRE-family HTH domain
MKLNEAMGDVLRELRMEQGLTLTELGERAFISIAHISQVERGVKQISSDLLESISDALDTPSSHIVLMAGSRMQLSDEKALLSVIKS